MRPPDCSFCEALRGRGDAGVIFEGRSVVVLLDRAPINRGHLLVIPRRHARDLLELTPDEVHEMALCAQRGALALRSTLGVDASNLVMSNGEAADQDVPHAHLHVVPRQEGDGYTFVEDTSRYPLVPLTGAERADLVSGFGELDIVDRTHRCSASPVPESTSGAPTGANPRRR